MTFQGRGQSHLHPWAGSVKLKIIEPPPINCRAPGGQGLRCAWDGQVPSLSLGVFNTCLGLSAQQVC